jgi:hypothetical protein
MLDLDVALATRLGSEGYPQIYDLQTSLAAQTDKNFIWLILLRPSAHSLEKELLIKLKKTRELWQRTQVIKCNTDNRSELLNMALSSLTTGYLSVFDDDDLPFSSYVKTIRSEAKKVSGKSIIRMQTVQIETIKNFIGERSYDVSVSNCKYLWPSTFDRLSHLQRNLTPCMSLSFPVALLKKYALVWDETLSAVEDWDFLMRSSEVIPVQSVELVTSIYRRVDNQYRSQKLIGKKEWSDSEKIVNAKIENQKFTLTGRQVITQIHGKYLAEPVTGARKFIKVVQFTQPRLLRFPWLYLIGKTTYRFLIKSFKIEKYV